MKKRTIVFVFIAFLGATAALGQTPEDIEGIWKMTYKKWELSDTIIEHSDFDFPSIKMFYKEKFSLSRVDEEGEFVGHFGDFKIDAERYTEKIKFSSYDYLIGRTVHFRSKLDGDRWIIQGDIGTKDMKFKLVEIWERME